MSDLVTISLRVPRILRDRMISLAANNPSEYYSTTEVWIKSANDFLQQHEVDTKWKDGFLNT